MPRTHPASTRIGDLRSNREAITREQAETATVPPKRRHRPGARSVGLEIDRRRFPLLAALEVEAPAAAWAVLNQELAARKLSLHVDGKRGTAIFAPPLCITEAELVQGIKDAFGYSEQVLIEKAVKPRELEVAVYQYGDELVATYPGEICVPQDKFYTYEEKYSSASHTETALKAEGLTQAQSDAIHVVDFGSGKGYLTFAIHDYLQHVLGKQAKVTGVELRDDLVKLCSQVINKLGLHARASAKLTKLAGSFPCEVWIAKGGLEKGGVPGEMQPHQH